MSLELIKLNLYIIGLLCIYGIILNGWRNMSKFLKMIILNYLIWWGMMSLKFIW